MTNIDASELDFKTLNSIIRETEGSVTVKNCLGHRYIADGLSDKEILIEGTPGNALGAYLNGAKITVKGNAQDAVGDTMNNGAIDIFGSIGDAAGYAMRGGEIFVRDNAGYRAGIHMKEYKEKRPVMVIGGRAGSFLGEYQAGGIIVILGLNTGERPIVGNFPCTGMHGGRVYLRSDCQGVVFPKNVTVSEACKEDMEEIEQYIDKYCRLFGTDKQELMSSGYKKIVPDSKNPYKQMYVANY